MIKFVFFDVGGVVIDDFSNANKIEEVRNKIKIGKFFDLDYLWMKIVLNFSKLFPEIYKKLLIRKIEHFKRIESLWPVISEIDKHSRVGLLTNMYPNMLFEIKKAGLLPTINWDVVIDSSVVNLRKPDRQMFKIAEDMSGFKGKEILFIDNGKENIKSAFEFGWNTFLYKPTEPEKSNQNLLLCYENLK